MGTLENLFAEKLLKVKAIKLQPSNPFTWASGWKSPFYCDNRKTLSYPSLRNFVKVEISRLVLEKCDFKVKIPMKGDVNSLNASVAAALFIYETVRQNRM